MDAEGYRKKLEIDILKIIEDKLQKGQMNAERAKDIARMLLDKLHPPLTLEQIHQIAPTLDVHFAELSSAIFPIVQDHEEEVKKVVSEHAQKLMQSGKIKEALSILKQANKQSV